MRIGLTGASGVLGQSIREQYPDPKWSVFTGDVAQFPEVRAWTESLFEADSSLDAVIHFAARVPTLQVAEAPLEAFRINSGGVLHVLEGLRQAVEKAKTPRKPWFFLASSSHVYQPSNESLSESAPLRPMNLYGETKLLGEEYARSFARQFQWPVCIGRIFSFTNPRQAAPYFIPSMIRRIREAEPSATVEIHGLLGSRDFIATSEIHRMIFFLLERGAIGEFNLASGHGYRLEELVKRLCEKLGREDVRLQARPEGTAHLLADIAKLSSLGYRSQFPDAYENLEAVLDGVIPV